MVALCYLHDQRQHTTEYQLLWKSSRRHYSLLISSWKSQNHLVGHFVKHNIGLDPWLVSPIGFHMFCYGMYFTAICSSMHAVPKITTYLSQPCIRIEMTNTASSLFLQEIHLRICSLKILKSLKEKTRNMYLRVFTRNGH